MKTKYISNLNNVKSIKRSTTTVLLLLISADLAFILLHTIKALTPYLNDTLYSVTSDGGYAEMYQYLKWFWIIILLICISISLRSFSYISWILIFSYFLFDDAMSFHEILGGLIAPHLTFTPPFGLSAQDIGELVVSASAGLFLATCVLLTYLLGSRLFRKFSRDMFILTGALVFFGVFIDMVHAAIHAGWKVNFVLALIEDGGEMLVASVFIWYVLSFFVHDDATRPSLVDSIRTALNRTESAREV